MNIYDLVNQYGYKVIDLSKKYNGDNLPNYAYSMGYFISSMGCILDEMKLTDKQIKVLKDRVNENQNTKTIMV